MPLLGGFSPGKNRSGKTHKGNKAQSGVDASRHIAGKSKDTYLAPNSADPLGAASAPRSLSLASSS
jgi:hypothetical protein